MNMHCKPEMKLDFGAILANKKNKFLCFRPYISLAMGDWKSTFGAVSYNADLNIWGKWQSHSSRASYISMGQIWNLVIFVHV